MVQDNLPLKGVSILVVEDEPLIALDIATTLEDAGAVITGVYSKVVPTLNFLGSITDDFPLHGAVLDINLGRETSRPIAEALQARGIPFIFHTGTYLEVAELIKGFDAPVIRKPATGATLVKGLATQLGRQPEK